MDKVIYFEEWYITIQHQSKGWCFFHGRVNKTVRHTGIDRLCFALLGNRARSPPLQVLAKWGSMSPFYKISVSCSIVPPFLYRHRAGKLTLTRPKLELLIMRFRYCSMPSVSPFSKAFQKAVRRSVLLKIDFLNHSLI